MSTSKLSYDQLHSLFVKYMDYVSLQEGDFYLDMPGLSEEEYEELSELANEVIYSNLEDDEPYGM